VRVAAAPATCWPAGRLCASIRWRRPAGSLVGAPGRLFTLFSALIDHLVGRVPWAASHSRRHEARAVCLARRRPDDGHEDDLVSAAALVRAERTTTTAPLTPSRWITRDRLAVVARHVDLRLVLDGVREFGMSEMGKGLCRPTVTLLVVVVARRRHAPPPPTTPAERNNMQDDDEQMDWLAQA
jgi:hypothetical protein